jgi:hypothetical protein
MENPMNIKTTTAKASLLATVALLAVPAVATSAHAQGGDAVRNSAACATGTIKVKAKVDDGMLSVEGELDTNRVGQSWNWKIVRNGTVVVQGSKVTAAPSGSFSVSRLIANPAGQDTIAFRAVRPATGQACGVSVQV